ncbi:MAG: hypothetical protein H7067_16165 [Burkholderiales bacterium]|nr:hypothetical protein [Opitutaceae bacterium]
MKPFRRLALAALVAASALSVFAQSRVLEGWNFTEADSVGGVVQVPSSSGGTPLRFKAEAQARLVVDADENNRQVLVLSGAQTEPGRGLATLDAIPAVHLRVRFRPASSGPVLQTIVTFGGCYELRQNRERNRVEFIVTHADKKYTFARVEVAPDLWNEAVATYKDGRLSLTIGLARGDAALPEGAAVASIPTSFRVGIVGERPFHGSISEIVLSAP